jgi:hypothetical protein
MDALNSICVSLQLQEKSYIGSAMHAHPSNEPSSVKIDVPTNLYDDKASWMGLFLCAYFSVRKDQSEMLDSSISPQLFLVIWKAIM